MTEGLSLWIPGIDSIFQEEALLILTAVVISFSLVCGMALACVEKETICSDLSSKSNRRQIFIFLSIINGNNHINIK